MIHLLMISPYFHPYTGVGGLRMSSLARYLGTISDIKLTVVKLRNKYYMQQNLIAEKSDAIQGIDYYELDIGQFQNAVLQEVLDKINGKTPVDCCLLSCGPFYTIDPVVGFLKNKSIPLILDYRDLWLYDVNDRHDFWSRIITIRKRILFRKSERQVLKRCDLFVTISHYAIKIMEKHYAFLRKKTCCIYNGYETVKLSTRARVQTRKDQITLCVLGKFAYYSPEFTEAFLKAILQIREESYDVVVHHIGAHEPLVDKILCNQNSSEKVIIEHGMLDYDKALNLASQFDLMVVIVRSKEGLGTKLFDYIQLNKPIICIGPQGCEIGEIMNEAENFFLCQTVEQVKMAIKTVMARRNCCLTTNHEFIKRFSRTIQNQRFEKAIRDVVDQSKKTL